MEWAEKVAEGQWNLKKTSSRKDQEKQKINLQSERVHLERKGSGETQNKKAYELERTGKGRTLLVFTPSPPTQCDHAWA